MIDAESDRPAGIRPADADPADEKLVDAEPAAELPLDKQSANDAAARQLRRDKADRATRGVLAAVLCLEAMVVLLVPRAIAQTSTGLDTGKTILLLVLAVVLCTTGFLLRRPWGIGLGSALQVCVLATGVLTPAMFVVGILFLAIWLWVLTMRRDLVGTPGNARLLIS